MVDLGAGLDTLYFWLQTEMQLESNSTAEGGGKFGGRKPEELTFFELDFPMVINKKTKTVLKKSRELGLGAHLAARAADHTMENSVFHIRQLKLENYRMVGCDIRRVEETKDLLGEAGFNVMANTLFLSECVLVYMQSLHADEVLKMCRGLCANSS